jgi:hypothetical protein
MWLSSVDRLARSAILVAFLFVTSSAQADNVNPFSKLGGSWSGGGTISMASGAKEKIHCRSGYVVADTSRNALRMDLRCTGETRKFELQSDLNHDNGEISGVWSENANGVSGKILGSMNGAIVRVVAESQLFQAMIELTTRGDRQSIKIQSPGSEMSEVLISLNRNQK